MKKIFTVTLVMAVMAVMSYADNDSASHDINITVSEVVIMELNNSGSISLTTQSPGAGNAGQSVVGESDNSKRLFYTSLVPALTSRTITAQIDSALTLPGLALELTASPAGGNEGAGAGTITLSTSAQNIVTGIGSCATGNTGSDGAGLTYELVITDSEALEVDATGETVTVTLTLTDAS
ncbi:MAG: hypothetical protein JW874_10025 [Spirochaetales bacterium]|nr:hypothetical protein [Spirochaetales bacterium]